MQNIDDKMRALPNIISVTKNISLHLQLKGKFGATHCVTLLCDIIKHCHVQYSVCGIE